VIIPDPYASFSNTLNNNDDLTPLPSPLVLGLTVNSDNIARHSDYVYSPTLLPQSLMNPSAANSNPLTSPPTYSFLPSYSNQSKKS
jgi:hypothetical protein